MNELLKKREDLFRKMLEISRQQLEFCRRDDVDSDLGLLQEFMGQRQVLMDEIDQLNALLLSGHPTAELSSMAGDGIRSGYHPAQDDQLVALMESISRNDETCLQILQTKSGELAKRIKQTRTSRQAADAYGQGNSIYDAWFIDKKK